MQRFWWPGHELRLIGGLQRQQNSLQFCDILLQTEGISVPAHSCVLAALCPQLSQRLSAFPAAPSHQCRMLHLQAVKGQTLRKLITLLYFGEVEVKGSMEENDLLSVTQQVGITLLVKGQTERTKKLGQSEKNKCSSFEQMVEKSDSEKSQSREMRDVQVQTETPGERTTGSQTEKRCCVSTGTQTVEERQSPALPPQNIPLDEPFHLLPFIPSVPSGAPSYGESTSGVTSGITSTDNTTNENVTDSQSVEQPSHDRHERPEKGNLTAQVLKSLVEMKDKTQVSLKMRLRRRRRSIRETWEVVMMQGVDEMTSALTYNGLSSVVHTAESQILPPSAPIYEPPAHLLYDSQLPCTDHFTLNQNPAPEPVLLSQPLGPDEESDENIEKLLEDIMMGLNILPVMERDSGSSHQPQPCYAGAPASCHVPVTESGWLLAPPQAAASAAGTQRPINPAPNQLSCSNFSSDAVYQQQQQQQQQSTQCPSSLRAMGQILGNCHQDMPWFTSQNCSCPEAFMTKSFLPSGFCSSEKKRPAWQEPPANGSEMQPLHHFPSLWSLPLCLSPLKTFDEATRNQPLTPLDRPWITEDGRLARFPQSGISRRGYAPGSQDAKRIGWSMQRQTHQELNSRRKKGNHSVSFTGRQVHAVKPGVVQMKGMRKRSSKHKQCRRKGDAALTKKKRKRRRTFHIQDAAGHVLALKNLKISEEAKRQISRSVCTVNLSSNNMLAVGRETATCSSGRVAEKMAPKEKQIAHSRKRKTRDSAEPCANHTAITDQSEVVAPKRRPGRPRKIKLVDLSEVRSQTVESEHQPHVHLPATDKEDVKRKTGYKRQGKGGRGRVNQPMTGAAEYMGMVDEVHDSDVILVQNEPKTPMQWVEKLIDPQHSKAGNSQENPGDETAAGCKVDRIRDAKASDGGCGGLTEETVMDLEVTPPQIRDTTRESQVVVTVCGSNPALENGRSQGGEGHSSSGEGNGIFSDCSVLFPDVLEDVEQLTPERELSGMNPDEDPAQQAAVSDEESSDRDTHTPLQGDRNSIHNNTEPRTQERTDPPLSSGAESIESSGCNQAKEEEEVDIMCYSPDSAAQSTECQISLNAIDIDEEEEEEEDETEIDVTGD